MDKQVFHDIWAELDLPKLSLKQRETRLENLLIPMVTPEIRYRTIPLISKPHTQSYEITVPGLDPCLRPLLFCSHHDYIGKGLGVVDNWTGVMGVLNLLQEALAQPFRHTTIFLWFCEEELGQRGSEHYVKHFLPELPGVVVNLECLGCQPLAYAAAYRPEAIPVKAKWSHYARTPSDSVNFTRHHIPTVTLDGLSTDDETFYPPLHTIYDTRDSLKPNVLHQTYTEIEEYARVLDEACCVVKMSKGTQVI